MRNLYKNDFLCYIDDSVVCHYDKFRKGLRKLMLEPVIINCEGTCKRVTRHYHVSVRRKPWIDYEWGKMPKVSTDKDCIVQVFSCSVCHTERDYGLIDVLDRKERGIYNLSSL